MKTGQFSRELWSYVLTKCNISKTFQGNKFSSLNNCAIFNLKPQLESWKSASSCLALAQGTSKWDITVFDLSVCRSANCRAKGGAQEIKWGNLTLSEHTCQWLSDRQLSKTASKTCISQVPIDLQIADLQLAGTCTFNYQITTGNVNIPNLVKLKRLMRYELYSSLNFGQLADRKWCI